MMEQILLSSDAFEGVREIGGFGQPLHALYPQIRTVLTDELGAKTAEMLAEPVVDRTRNRIDWYIQGDPEKERIALRDLPAEQQEAVLAQVRDVLASGRQLAERYAASGDDHRVHLGAMLRIVFADPEEMEVFQVDGRPVITRWGFAKDRPWETSGALPRSPRTPQLSLAASAVVAPEAVTPPVTPLAETPRVSNQDADLPALESPPPASPAESASLSTVAAASSAAPSSDPASPAVPPPPPSGLNPSPTLNETNPAARRTANNSRYLWGLALLILLLAMGVVLWNAFQEPPYPPGGRTGLPPAVTALDHSQNQPLGNEPGSPVQPEPLHSPPAGQPSRPPSAEPGTAAIAPAAPATGVSPVTVVPGGITAADGIQRESSPLATDTDAMPPVTTMPAAPEHEPSAVPLPVVTAPGAPEHGSSAARSAQADTPVGFTDGVRSPEPSSGERAPPLSDPLARALENELTRPKSPASATPSQSSLDWPVRAEPSAEERQEFASRLSAAGALSGEITATLLWNSNADLDLVVNCPSGQILDYQNPANCGGTLDVDANTARNSLSDRPVENAFWPAGQAEPGRYQLAVRYAPRKDEPAPQPIPFQVRLIRNGQEAVFKGTVQPNRLVPVTRFTVER